MNNNFYKQTTIFLLIFVIIFSSTNVYSLNSDYLNIRGEAALIYDDTYDSILYSKNINKKLYPASTTKVLTAILVLENADLNDMVRIDKEVVENTYGSHISLDYNEEISVDDLLHALLIASANDAALALAKHVSGSIEAFVDLMNQKAQEIGTTHTHFSNPNGLHNDNHYSTAYDLLLISKYAMDNNIFKKIVSIPKYKIKATNKKEDRIIYNTNKFLHSNEKTIVNNKSVPIYFEGVSGLKTGYTDEAGRCLITYAENDNRKIYTIVLKSNYDNIYSDTLKLLDESFYKYSVKKIGYKNEFIQNVKVKNSYLPTIPATLDDDIYYLSSDRNKNVSKKVIFKENIKAPIKKGTKLGEINYFIDGNLIKSSKIVSPINVETRFKGIVLNPKDNWYIIVLLIFLLVELIKFSYRIRLYYRNSTKNRPNY